MNDVLPIIGVAAIAFLATNADNLLLLFAFLADRSFKPWQVIVGYALGMVAILALSCLVAWFAHFLRPDYVGFLGIVPIGFGLKRLFDRFVRHADSAKPASSKRSTHSQIITVALADIAHGPDTIILFSALLADADLVAQFSISIAYLFLVIAWCSLGFFLLRHPRVRGPAQRYGDHLSPYLLIGVGIYIVLNTIHDLAPP
jgi:cadmium resistance protein CadD (predicted permease)